jgi:hypothetical protein
VARQIEVDVFQVVRAGAADADFVHAARDAARSAGRRALAEDRLEKGNLVL